MYYTSFSTVISAILDTYQVPLFPLRFAHSADLNCSYTFLLLHCFRNASELENGELPLIKASNVGAYLSLDCRSIVWHT